MEHSFLEYLEITANLGTTLAGVSLIFVVVQLIREARGKNLQSFFYLHKYLSQNEFSAARHLVRTNLISKPYKDWVDEDKKMANKVCASYDQAGLLILTGIMNKKTKIMFLKSSWGESMCDQYEILSGFLSDKQTPNKTGKEFFCHFCDLYSMAKKYHRDETI